MLQISKMPDSSLDNRNEPDMTQVQESIGATGGRWRGVHPANSRVHDRGRVLSFRPAGKDRMANVQTDNEIFVFYSPYLVGKGERANIRMRKRIYAFSPCSS